MAAAGEEEDLGGDAWSCGPLLENPSWYGWHDRSLPVAGDA